MTVSHGVGGPGRRVPDPLCVYGVYVRVLCVSVCGVWSMCGVYVCVVCPWSVYVLNVCVWSVCVVCPRKSGRGKSTDIERRDPSLLGPETIGPLQVTVRVVRSDGGREWLEDRRVRRRRCGGGVGTKKLTDRGGRVG